MVSFYKHEIPNWMDGTETLSDGAYRAYHVIVQLIMLNEGPIMLNERGIAGRCNQSPRSFRKNLEELLAAGKLTLEAGRLANRRAAVELAKVNENRQNASSGGKNSAESRRTSRKSENSTSKSGETDRTGDDDPPKSLKNKPPPQASLQESGSLKDKTRLDETQHSHARPNGHDRASLDQLEAALREASGHENSADPALCDLSPILGLLDAGYDLEAHVLPVLRAKARTGRKGRSWSWYVPAIQDSATARAGVAQRSPPADAAPTSDEDLERGYRHMVERFKANPSTWPPRMGPRPGEPGCRIGRHILAEYGYAPSHAA